MKEIKIPGFTTNTEPTDKPTVSVFGTEGAGKAQPLDSLVLTATGWRAMGSLQVGEQVRCPNNTLARIVGIFPQGVRDAYSVQFRDKRIVECCAEHLWSIFCDAWKRRGTPWKTVSTRDLLSLARADGALELHASEQRYVPLSAPLTLCPGEDTPLPLDPYLLGALIGDGGLTGITPTFTKQDSEVVMNVRRLVRGMGLEMRKQKLYTFSLCDPDATWQTPNRLTTILRSLGVTERAEAKHIPSIYLHASISSRWKLAQGLMDTDGTVSGKTPSFSTSSKQLAEDFQRLMWSLGCEANLSSRIPHYTYKGEKKAGLEAYRVSVRLKDARKLFSVKRHLSRITGLSQYASDKLRIDSITFSRRTEVQCIKIDHPKQLYVTDQFIVTHNTHFSCTAPDPIGLLPLDRKSKRTFDEVKKELKKYVICPTEKDYMKPKEAIKLSLLDGSKESELKQVQEAYTEIYKRVMDDAMKLADHPDIQTIVVDSNTQFWDWILFSHFGRKNQIESYQRGAPNNDMIDFVTAMKHKNLVLLHRSADIWKDTGQTDKKGNKKQAPSGKHKAEGCSKLGYLITCEIELISADLASTLDKKFKCKVRECQNNPLIEGELLDDYGVVGEGLNWDNLMSAIGWVD